MKIFYWPASTSDGCFLYRIKMVSEALAARGHEVQMDTRIGTWARDEADVVIGQRVCMNAPTAMWQALAGAKETPLVLELDDDLFAIDPRQNRLADVFKDPKVRQNLTANLRAADLVTVSTEPLAKVMRRYSGNVAVLPNSIRQAVLDMPLPKRRGKPLEESGGRVVIGWQGSATHEEDWRVMGSSIVDTITSDPATFMRFLGTFHPAGMPVGQFELLPWTTDLMEHYRRVARFDIGLAPLNGTLFNESKCLDASTRVGTDRGFLRIDQIQPGMKVWREGWRDVRAVEQSPARPGIQLTLSNGQKLRLTAEHRMMSGGSWKRADALRVGDALVSGQNFVGTQELQSLPWPANVRHGRKGEGFDEWGYLSSSDSPRLTVTPRIGRILGAYVGDGSCAATSINISCDGQDQDWIEMLMADFREIGLTPKTEQKIMFNGTVLRRRAIRVASASFQRVIESIGLAEQRSYRTPKRVPRVPEVIWRSPLPVIAEFLAGYFEADGHCNRSGVGLTSKTEELIRDVQQLLLLFGIESTVRTRVYRAQNGFSGDYWTLTLRRAAADIFVKEIGFRSQRKQKRLEEITSRPHSNAYRPMSWSPVIVAIEPCAVEPVDIQVEGEAFMAAGLLSHNSALRFVEAAALGVPMVCSDVPAYRAVVDHGVTGFLARNPKEWREYVQALVDDPALRVRIGDAAREAAQAWTIEQNVTRWEEAYASLL